MDRLADLRGWRRILVLVLLAAAVRVVLLLAVRGDPLTGEAAVQVDLATRLAGGQGLAGTFPEVDLHSTGVAVPANAFVLGLLFELVGPSVTGARLLGLVVGVGVVLAVDRLGVRVATGPLDGRAASLAGLVGAVAVALHPVVAARDVLPLGTSLVALALVALLLGVLDGRAVLAGIAGGLLVLLRPEAVVVVGAVVVWAGVRTEWRRAGWLLLVASLVVFPWLLRNSIVLGSPVLSTDTGRQLVALYADEAHERGIGVDAATDPAFDDLALTRFDEVAWDRTLRERALEDLGGDPRRVVDVAGRNLMAQLELLGDENRAADERDGVGATVRVLGLLAWPVVLLGGVVGLVRLRRGRGVELLIVAAVAVLGANLVLVVATPTARVPLDVLLCVGLGLGVAAWASERPSRGSGPRPRSPASPDRRRSARARRSPTR